MATQIAPLTDAAYTPEQAVLTDTIANEVYAAHYNERRTSRIVIGGLSVLLLGSFASIVALAHKPVINRYIRIDEMGKAQAIQYSDLNYSYERRCKTRPQSASRAAHCGGVKVGHRRILVS